MDDPGAWYSDAQDTLGYPDGTGPLVEVFLFYIFALLSSHPYSLTILPYFQYILSYYLGTPQGVGAVAAPAACRSRGLVSPEAAGGERYQAVRRDEVVSQNENTSSDVMPQTSHIYIGL